MIGRGHIQLVPSIFDQGMLKTSACSQKTSSSLSRVANRFQGALHTPVRTSRHAPESVESFEFREISTFHHFRVAPGPADLLFERFGRKSQRFRYRLVCQDGIRIISDQE